jgi:hypothetical protein
MEYKNKTDSDLVKLFNSSYNKCINIKENTPNKILIFIDFYKNYMIVMQRLEQKISILSRPKTKNEKSTRNKMIETRKELREAITKRKKEVDNILTALGDKNILLGLVKKSENTNTNNLMKNAANKIQIQYNANQLNKNNTYLLTPIESELNILRRRKETLTNLELKKLQELEALANQNELNRLQRNINSKAKAN